MSRMTKSERRTVRMISALLPLLKQQGVVKAMLPDGETVLVKGRDALHAITASGIPRQMSIMTVPVLSIEMAAALEDTLGGDGFYSAPDHVGHA